MNRINSVLFGNIMTPNEKKLNEELNLMQFLSYDQFFFINNCIRLSSSLSFFSFEKTFKN